MHYVLILILHFGVCGGGGFTSTVAEFETKEACEVALAWASQVAPAYVAGGKCFPKA